MKLSKRLLSFLGAAAVVLTTLGALRLWQGSPPQGRAASLVPETAALYVNLYVQPSNTQKRALRDLLEAADRPAQTLAAEIEDLFAPLLAGSGIDFERDIEPWLGREVALFHQEEAFAPRGPAVAMLVEATDQEKAERFAADLDQGPFEAVLIEDFVAIGNKSGVLAVRGARVGSNLALSPQYLQSAELLPPDRVVTIYQRHEISSNRRALDDHRDAAALYFEDGSAILEGTFALTELVSLPSRLRTELGALVSFTSGQGGAAVATLGDARVSFGSTERDGITLGQVVFSF